MSIEIRREGMVAFTVPMPRALFRDVRLTFGARGLFGFLWDLPEGWVLRLDHLVTMGPEGRDALRARLRELEHVGAVRIEAIRADGGRVAGKRWVLVAADRWAIEAPLSKGTMQDSDSAEKRVSRSSAKPIIGKPDTKVLQGVKALQGEAAAPRAHARGPAVASAAPPAISKRRAKRPSGIVTWTADDRPEAERIEQLHSADEIGAAVAALGAAGKEPVPGLVARELERQQRERDTAERRAAAEAAHAVRLAAPPPIDLAARQRGEQLLAGIRRQRDEREDVSHG